MIAHNDHVIISTRQYTSKPLCVRDTVVKIRRTRLNLCRLVGLQYHTAYVVSNGCIIKYCHTDTSIGSNGNNDNTGIDNNNNMTIGNTSIGSNGINSNNNDNTDISSNGIDSTSIDSNSTGIGNTSIGSNGIGIDSNGNDNTGIDSNNNMTIGNIGIDSNSRSIDSTTVAQRTHQKYTITKHHRHHLIITIHPLTTHAYCQYVHAIHPCISPGTLALILFSTRGRVLLFDDRDSLLSFSMRGMDVCVVGKKEAVRRVGPYSVRVGLLVDVSGTYDTVVVSHEYDETDCDTHTDHSSGKDGHDTDKDTGKDDHSSGKDGHSSGKDGHDTGKDGSGTYTDTYTDKDKNMYQHALAMFTKHVADRLVVVRTDMHSACAWYTAMLSSDEYVNVRMNDCVCRQYTTGHVGGVHPVVRGSYGEAYIITGNRIH